MMNDNMGLNSLKLLRQRILVEVVFIERVRNMNTNKTSTNILIDKLLSILLRLTGKSDLYMVPVSLCLVACLVLSAIGGHRLRRF